MKMTLADGRTQTTEILTTSVDISIQGKVIPTELLILKNARGNRTLLGIDFLTAAGIVLDLQRKQWYFTETSHRKYNFVKAPPNINALLTVDPKPHLCQLRKNEGTHLSLPQREEINSLLEKYEECFQPGGEPTPLIEHRINTRNHLPVAVPPYRMNPSKKEILKQEIDRLLSEDIIEECESPYASPVVLIPKPNGTFRLCIDYRKLNEITIADTYHLPRMDDLLHQAKLTPFMSTLDLRAGYHQVKVHVEDQDKTEFVCPFGTYRFLRMPYGLRNAPATFQRLMNRFCNGLEDILALPYLDDIIVLSETFEKHMFDLKTIFERLLHFKLKANREKCHFTSSRVKYLGFWITQKGIEVDPEKVASILDIPPPKNVKELQSFLQTCSWFRRYIQDFAKISRPLSYLTKKKVKWQWGFDQQNAFQTLKNSLTAPPVLKQADGTKPYIIRTDASNYALGAVLLQGEGSDEHPIEYASRLLTPAERNYSTTERGALAVVWALKKFRGYIEGTEITVASDHQPLKWLLNLKSPTGRLARWALEIQSFNLKVQYIPGKANVVADMLSRPVTQEEESFCEENNITIADMPTRSCKDMREAQLKDDNLKKIIDSFESPLKTEEYANWTERGFLMNQGVLYRYVPDADSAEAQLVIPTAERELIMGRHHNDPMAGHYGEEGTFRKSPDDITGQA
ncbi:retrovirus-related Pol polyprotein from transposon 17.6 [Trichonephila clavipes]|nr:retrovirus-related Pol polyprotein from transposon 17.6 [Trichonephila clavipes]